MDTYITALYWSVARANVILRSLLAQENSGCICFYVRSFTTMTTVGYGDVSPVSRVEKIFCMVAMMVGYVSAH